MDKRSIRTDGKSYNFMCGIFRRFGGLSAWTVGRPWRAYTRAALPVSLILLERAFHRHFPPEFRLYDLRHTFTTAAQQAHCYKSWVDLKQLNKIKNREKVGKNRQKPPVFFVCPQIRPDTENRVFGFAPDQHPK